MAEKQVQNCGAEKAMEIQEVISVVTVEAPKAENAVQFYKAVFGAVEVDRTTCSKRKADLESPLVSAVLKLGNVKLIVKDSLDDQVKAGPGSPKAGFGSILVIDEDVAGLIEKAVLAGGVAEGVGLTEDDAFPGKQLGGIRDPFGYVWTIAGISKSTVDETEPNNFTTTAEDEAQPRIAI